MNRFLLLLNFLILTEHLINHTYSEMLSPGTTTFFMATARFFCILANIHKSLILY